MDYEPTKAEIKEFTCHTCHKECEEIHYFNPIYGSEERKKDASKNRNYCEPCFGKRAQQLS